MIRLFRRRLAVWYHPSFRLPFTRHGSATPMDARRADNVITWLLDQGLVRETDVFEAPEATYGELRRAHDDAWLAALDELDTVRGVVGTNGDLPVASLLEMWRRGVGAAVAASAWVLDNRGIAATLMGGFHHAYPDRGAGFCALNDMVVAIQMRRAAGLEGPIAIIDLDAHPPDGTGAFGISGVFIRSVSTQSEWIADNALDLRVPPGTGDEAYLAAVDEALRFDDKPVLAFYLAGSDPLAGDPLGGLAVSAEGLRERDRRVFDALDGVPTVVVPGGGYTPRSWTVLAGTLAEAARSWKTVDPSYDPVARRVGRIAQTLGVLQDGPLITEEDLGLSPGRLVEPRFLNFYTRHGVELAMDRYGLMDALGRMGFIEPRVDLETRGWPHRMRITGGFAGKRATVVDLKLSFRQVDRWRTIFIEWLELVDPRVPLDTHRPGLPGQAHPGLGLAREVASILDVASRRVGCGGLSFVPSHYHVAWIARKQSLVEDPVLRGQFRALREYLADVPLPLASERLARGLPTEDGELFTWKPSLMVRALDPDLRDWLRSTEDKARRAQRSLAMRLLPVHVAFPELDWD